MAEYGKLSIIFTDVPRTYIFYDEYEINSDRFDSTEGAFSAAIAEIESKWWVRISPVRVGNGPIINLKFLL